MGREGRGECEKEREVVACRRLMELNGVYVQISVTSIGRVDVGRDTACI